MYLFVWNYDAVDRPRDDFATWRTSQKSCLAFEKSTSRKNWTDTPDNELTSFSIIDFGDSQFLSF